MYYVLWRNVMYVYYVKRYEVFVKNYYEYDVPVQGKSLFKVLSSKLGGPAKSSVVDIIIIQCHNYQ
jgi:hypothetical protein